MLDAMERARRDFPAAFRAANAGIPRSVEGRNIYLCSPEYMASSAQVCRGGCATRRRMLRNHARSIRAMKSALRVGEARGKQRRPM